MTLTMRDRFRGCLLGGAVGDALGAPVEFMGHREIVRKFGKGGIRDYVPAYGLMGAITDDTQMTLFTAEDLLRALMRLDDISWRDRPCLPALAVTVEGSALPACPGQ